MLLIPTHLAGLIRAFAPVFVHRSWRHAQILPVGAILTLGRRTVTIALRNMGCAQMSQFVNVHRILKRAAWCPRSGSRILLDRLDAVSRRATWIALAISCLVSVAFDWSVPAVGTGPLYIPLIALAGWRLGSRAACSVALVAAFLNILPVPGFDAGLSPFAAAVRGAVRLGAYAFVVATVCGLQRVHDRERYAARHGALTGVLNRASFEEHTRSALERCAANGPVTVLALADIDSFKSVNDTVGHAAGDKVLVRFASAGAAAIGQGDRFGRLGGDKFVLLLQASTVTAVVSRVETIHRRF